LERWLRKDQYQNNLIVQQILCLVDEELCKEKFPKGIVWPKRLQPKKFRLLLKWYIAWLLG
jgi:hypothetical protein